MKQTQPTPSLLSLVIPPRNSNRDPVALEAAMQSLALDERHPIALEIVGTSTRKQFLLRATTSQGHAHAEAQLRARYPQARIVPVAPDDDPLQLGENETVSVIYSIIIPLLNHADELESMHLFLFLLVYL